MNLFGPPSFVAEPPNSSVDTLPCPLARKKPKWLGDDGANVFIEVQGNFAAVAIRRGPRQSPAPPRGEIKGFSKASRLRLFKLTNRLDFNAAGRCSFFTATWPDHAAWPSREKITQARSQTQRWLEGQAGRHVSGIWRVEWKKRKSGDRVGEFWPHVHTIAFNVPWISRQMFTDHWAGAIDWNQWVDCDVREIVNLRHMMSYISKYIAKGQASGLLDIEAYLNNHHAGRKWGVYRKNLLPVCDRFECRIPPGPVLERLRAIAMDAWKGCPDDEDEGFTVFGPQAAEIEKIVQEYLDGCPPREVG